MSFLRVRSVGLIQQAIGIASELNSVFSVARSKLKALGQPSETDSAFSMTAQKSASGAPLLQIASGRYFVTPSLQPVFLVGDTAWSLALGITEAEALTYMQTRASQGFTAIFMDTVGYRNIIGAANGGSAISTDLNGNAPFNATLSPGVYDVSAVPAPGDVNTTSAGRYWTHIDNLLTMAQGLGLQVVLDPYDTYAAWFSSDNSFSTDGHSPNSTAKLLAYGQFLGQRYASRPNILWVFGNDYNQNATGDANIATVIDGIRQFDTVHTISLEMNPPNGNPYAAFDNAALHSRLNVNGIYEYNVGPYRAHYLAQYSRSDFGPTMNLETGYELNSGIGATPSTVRSGHYVMMLCGSCGDLYGNERVGGAGFGTNSGPWAADWVAQLTSQGGVEMSRFATFLASIAWHTLVPDQTGTTFVGVGSPTDYCGARAANGTLAVAYQPPTGSGTKSFVVNKAQMAGPITARWFDPCAGTYTAIGSGIANSGQQTFTTPGNNSSGANDWVLVLTASGAGSAFAWTAPTQAQEQAFYDLMGWTYTAGNKVPEFPSNYQGFTTASSQHDIHNDFEGDDLQSFHTQFERTGLTVYQTWMNGWLDYYRSGAYLTDLQQAGQNEANQVYPDHVFGPGLVKYAHAFNDAAALAAATNIGAFVESKVAGLTIGSSQMAQYGDRGRARWLLLAAYLYAHTGLSRWQTLLNKLIDCWIQSPDFSLGKIGGMYYFSRVSILDSQAISDAIGGTAAYDAGRRAMSTFQMAILSEALWKSYEAVVGIDNTRAAALISRLEQISWWMFHYAHDPNWVCPMVGAYVGHEGNKTRWHRETDSGNANLSSGAAEYDTSIVGTLVRGFKITGQVPMLNLARKAARNGQDWAPAAYGAAKITSGLAISHFIDTQADPGFYFDYNKGEGQYCGSLYENGGVPTQIVRDDGTAISNLRKTIAIGSMAELVGFGNGAAVADATSVSGNILSYGSVFHYDPITNRFYFTGSSHNSPQGQGPRTVAFDVATNAWVTLIPSSQPGSVAHGYNNACLDVAMRRYWFGAGGVVSSGLSYIDLSDGSLHTNQGPGFGSNQDDAPAMCYFPERRDTYWFHGSTYDRKREDGAWVSNNMPAQLGYSCMALYHPKRKTVWVGGGNAGAGSSLSYRIDENGTLKTLANAPISIDDARVEAVYDPSTGLFNVYCNDGNAQQNGNGIRFFTFDPHGFGNAAGTGVWVQGSTNFSGLSAAQIQALFAVDSSDNILRMIAGHCPAYGINLFAAAAVGQTTPRMFIYRWA